MNINDIRKLNAQRIEELTNIQSDSEATKLKKQVHQKIKNIIEEDDAIFFKLDLEDSLKILNCLFDISDAEILNIYKELVSPKTFKNLEDNFLI